MKPYISSEDLPDEPAEMNFEMESFDFNVKPSRLNVNWTYMDLFKFLLMTDHPEAYDKFMIWLDGRECNKLNWKLYLLEKL